MGWFKRLFSGAPSNRDDVQSAEADEPQRIHVPWTEDNAPRHASIELLFDRLPDSLDATFAEWGLLKPQLGEIKPAGSLTESGLLYFIQAGEHQFKLFGMSAPLPEDVQERTIHLSNWTPEVKARLYAHRAHMVLFYDGGSADAAEQLAMLYAFAAAAAPLGLTDETACNCIPGDMLQEMVRLGELDNMTHDLPSFLCTGVIKYAMPDRTIYYTSRGFERFGLANLALRAPANSGEMVMNTFHNILNYQWQSGARIEAGHTSEMGDKFLEFLDPPAEFAEALSGGVPVLDIRIRQP